MKEAQIKINVNLKLLPFECASIEVKDYEKEIEGKGKESPVYTELKTTDAGLVEIAFNGENYVVPKTTNGLL